MTLEKAIFEVDELKPNQIERAQKIKWLSRLDQRIYEQIMCTHERDGRVPDEFIPYTQETDPDTELLVPEPFGEIYRFYLEMQIDLLNLEYDKYNNSAALYANALGQFSRYWHREHKPLRSAGAHHQF